MFCLKWSVLSIDGRMWVEDLIRQVFFAYCYESACFAAAILYARYSGRYQDFFVLRRAEWMTKQYTMCNSRALHLLSVLVGIGGNLTEL
jgi:hypothetical protein